MDIVNFKLRGCRDKSDLNTLASPISQEIFWQRTSFNDDSHLNRFFGEFT
jgi:pyrroloquinoline quinone (PQQ) biosynthesis protein C